MRMTRMTCVLVVRVYFYEFCCMNFLSQLRDEVSSLQTRVLVNFEVGFKARFLNGFTMILKMLYMHVKFEVGM